jgi:hypothetical protein
VQVKDDYIKNFTLHSGVASGDVWQYDTNSLSTIGGLSHGESYILTKGLSPMVYLSAVSTKMTVVDITNGSPATANVNSHGFGQNDKIMFWGLAVGSGGAQLTETSVYIVKNPSTNTFQIYSQDGTTAINTSASGAFANTRGPRVAKVIDLTQVGVGNHTLRNGKSFTLETYDRLVSGDQWDYNYENLGSSIGGLPRQTSNGIAGSISPGRYHLLKSRDDSPSLTLGEISTTEDFVDDIDLYEAMIPGAVWQYFRSSCNDSTIGGMVDGEKYILIPGGLNKVRFGARSTEKIVTDITQTPTAKATVSSHGFEDNDRVQFWGLTASGTAQLTLTNIYTVKNKTENQFDLYNADGSSAINTSSLGQFPLGSTGRVVKIIDITSTGSGTQKITLPVHQILRGKKRDGEHFSDCR